MRRSLIARWCGGATVTLLAVAGCNRAESPPQHDQTVGVAHLDDERVATYVQARYQADPQIRQDDIDVSVNSGVVTLRGTVTSDEARQRAIAEARQVQGVHSVDDQLQVRPPAGADVDRAAGVAAKTDTPASAADNTRVPGWITTKIQAQYFASPEVKPWNIDVTTNSSGVVILSGEVEQAADRDEAVRIARDTEGVTRVENRLRIKGESRDAAASGTAERRDPASAEEPDAWITAKVQAKYFVDPDVKGRNIDVDTSQGVVTLSGEVQSESERRQAVAIARNTDGVKSVTDRLQLRSSAPTTEDTRRPLAAVDDAWITTKIQSQLFLDQNVKGRAINVDTRKRIVTLTGTVASDLEKKAAMTIARETEGVERVVDQLKLDTTSQR